MAVANGLALTHLGATRADMADMAMTDMVFLGVRDTHRSARIEFNTHPLCDACCVFWQLMIFLFIGFWFPPALWGTSEAGFAYAVESAALSGGVAAGHPYRVTLGRLYELRRDEVWKKGHVDD